MPSLSLGLSLRGQLNNSVFRPEKLFTAAEQGVWYDPSDLSTLFQDSAGTTPVTAPAQTVGLMLDKSQGLALGPERLTNGNFSDGSTGWSVSGNDATHIATFSNGTLRYQSDTTTPILNVSQAGTMVVGKTYLVTVVTSAYTSGSIKSDAFGATVVLSNGLGTITFRGTASSTGFVITRNSTNVDITIDSVSIKEIAGNHATQATSTQRPTYGVNPITGTRNLLTYTEQFDNADWTKSAATIGNDVAISPDGIQNADKLIEAATTATHYMYRTMTPVNATEYTFSVYAKAAGRTIFRLNAGGGFLTTGTFDLSAVTATLNSGTSATITPVGNDWYRCTVSGVSSSTTAGQFQTILNTGTYAGDGTSGIFFWGAQMEASATATAYQKVVSQYEVTEAGVQSTSYLAFDGVDDGMVTPTITPAIDKVQVFAGVRKLSDAASGVLAELGPSSAANNGSITLSGPFDPAATAFYGFASRGTIRATAATLSGFAAPITNVLTGLGSISGDTATLRVNGAQVAQSTTDQGTGNYLAYPLYIGRRGGTTLPYNGRIYSLITRFGANLTDGQITSTESWVNSKTGAY